MESGTDRRTSRRVKLLKWSAKILLKDKSLDGAARNISESGAFIYYSQPHGNDLPLQPDQVVDLLIEVPERRPLFISAQVVWSHILSSDEKDTVLGAGLHFTDIFHEDRRFLQDFVAASN